MKYLAILILGIILTACGQKVPYTNQIRDEFGLESEKEIKKVQFFVSQTIILTRSKESGNTGTADDGALVTNENRVEDRITIPPQTKCIFEKYEATGDIVVRFETGVGHTLAFALRQQNASGKYYLVAKWDTNKGGEITYGNQPYIVASNAGNAYLMVKLKKLQKTKRKDRVVKGMKV